MSDTPTADEIQVFNDITALSEQFIKPYFISKMAGGATYEALMWQIGRALVLTGVNMVGNGGDLNDQQAIRTGQVCLEKLQKAIENKTRDEERKN